MDIFARYPLTKLGNLGKEAPRFGACTSAPVYLRRMTVHVKMILPTTTPRKKAIPETDTSQTSPTRVSAHSHFHLSLVPLLRCVFDASRVDMQINPGCVVGAYTNMKMEKNKHAKRHLTILGPPL